METLKYKIIKSDSQYLKYCDKLEELVQLSNKTKSIKEEIDILNLLIETYDKEHNGFGESDPIILLKHLMKEAKLKSVELAKLLNVSEGLVSDMLHYKKALSKETIRILSEKFKVSQEAFNRPYKLMTQMKTLKRKAIVLTGERKHATA